MIGSRCVVVTDWSNRRQHFARLVRVRSNNLPWFVLFLQPRKSSTAADYRLGSPEAGKLVESEVRRWVSCWKWDKKAFSRSRCLLCFISLFSKFNLDAPAEREQGGGAARPFCQPPSSGLVLVCPKGSVRPQYNYPPITAHGWVQQYSVALGRPLVCVCQRAEINNNTQMFLGRMWPLSCPPPFGSAAPVDFIAPARCWYSSTVVCWTMCIYFCCTFNFCKFE